jgi:hypothetical protein
MRGRHYRERHLKAIQNGGIRCGIGQRENSSPALRVMVAGLGCRLLVVPSQMLQARAASCRVAGLSLVSRAW